MLMKEQTEKIVINTGAVSSDEASNLTTTVEHADSTTETSDEHATATSHEVTNITPSQEPRIARTDVKTGLRLKLRGIDNLFMVLT
jgi:hypothetical protein